MAWGSSSGTVASANAKAASASFTTGAITCPSGDVIFLQITTDNTGTSLPTVTALTVPGGESATWQIAATHATSNNTAAASVKSTLMVIKTTQTWTAFSPVATLSASTTAKVSNGVVKSGGTPYQRSDVTPTGGTSTTSVPTFTLTSPRQPVSGDLVIGIGGFETATIPTDDADSTNGSWSAGITQATTGGVDNTNVSGVMQWKIVSGTGDQTYNPTNATSTDSGVTAAAFIAASDNTPVVYRVHSESLVLPVAQAQVGRVGLETLFDWPNRQYGSLAGVESAGTYTFHGTSNTTLAMTGISAPVYERALFVVAISVDNLTASTPTITLTKPANETNSWTYVQANSPQATAANGVITILAYIKTTVPWSYTKSFTFSGTASSGIVSKTVAAAIFYGLDNASPSWLTQGITSGPGVSNTPSAITATPVGTPRLGDLMVVVAGSEESSGGSARSVPNVIASSITSNGSNNDSSIALGYQIYDGTTATDDWISTIQDGGLIVMPFAFTGASLAQNWTTIGRVNKSLAESWETIGRVNKTLSETWETFQRVSKTVSETWDVSSGLARVDSTLSETWDVYSRDTKSLSETWGVSQRVAKTLSETWTVSVADSAALSGSGSLSVAVVPKPVLAVALSGSGSLSVAAEPRVSRTAALSGSGTLAAARLPAFARSVALSGSGTLSATKIPTLIRSVALSGSGTLSVPTRTPALTGTAALSGEGTLEAIVRAFTTITTTWNVAAAGAGAGWDSALDLTLGVPAGPVDITDAYVGSVRPFNQIWWKFTPTHSGTVIFDTSMTIAGTPADADTLIYLYSGDSYATRFEVNHNDDASNDTLLSQLTVVVRAGVEYHIAVGTFGSDGSTITAYILDSTVPVAVTYGAPTQLDPDDEDGEGYYGDAFTTGCKVATDVGLFFWNNQDEHPAWYARAARWSLDADGIPQVTMGDVVAGPNEEDLPGSPYTITGATSYRDIGIAYGLENGWAAVFVQELNALQSVFAQLVHVDTTTLEVTFGDLITDETFDKTPLGLNYYASAGEGRVLFSGMYQNRVSDVGHVLLSFDTTVDPPVPTLTFSTLPDDVDLIQMCDLGTDWLLVYVDQVHTLLHLATVPDVDGHPDFTATPVDVVTPLTSAFWSFTDTYVSPLMGTKIYIWNQTTTGAMGSFLVVETTTWTTTTHEITDLPAPIKAFNQGSATWSSFLPIDDVNMAVGWSQFISSAEGDGAWMGVFSGTTISQETIILPYEGWVNGIYNWEVIPVSTSGHVIGITIVDDMSTPRYQVPMLVAARLTPTGTGGGGEEPGTATGTVGATRRGAFL